MMVVWLGLHGCDETLLEWALQKCFHNVDGGFILFLIPWVFSPVSKSFMAIMMMMSMIGLNKLLKCPTSTVNMSVIVIGEDVRLRFASASVCVYTKPQVECVCHLSDEYY